MVLLRMGIFFLDVSRLVQRLSDKAHYVHVTNHRFKIPLEDQMVNSLIEIILMIISFTV